MAILKRQLEEKEKLLATEQEDAAVAKSKLRELNKVWPVMPHPESPWAVAVLLLGRGLPPYSGFARGCPCNGPLNQRALRLGA